MGWAILNLSGRSHNTNKQRLETRDKTVILSKFNLNPQKTRFRYNGHLSKNIISLFFSFSTIYFKIQTHNAPPIFFFFFTHSHTH